jgi:hypothetical protein
VIRDAETGSPVSFQATPEQLSGVKQGDRVLIKFTHKGEILVAEEIKTLR